MLSTESNKETKFYKFPSIPIQLSTKLSVKYVCRHAVLWCMDCVCVSWLCVRVVVVCALLCVMKENLDKNSFCFCLWCRWCITFPHVSSRFVHIHSLAFLLKNYYLIYDYKYTTKAYNEIPVVPRSHLTFVSHFFIFLFS